MTTKLLVVLTILLLCSGCWDMKEINQLAIVDMIAVDDTEDGKILAYYQVMDPPSIEARRSGPSKAAVYTYGVEGTSMGHILEHTGAVMSRNLYTSHLQCYIISERSARRGLIRLSNYLENYKERRTNVYALVTEEPVSEVINTFTILDRVPGRNIRLLMDWHARRLGINKLPTRVKDLVAGIPFSRPVILPMIQYMGDKAASNTNRLEDIQATKENLKLNGGAVFIKAKMVGKVSEDLKNLYYVLNGYASRKSETFAVNGALVDVELSNIRIKRKWEGNDVLHIHLDINMGVINNEQKEKLTITNIAEIERQFNLYYKEKCDNFNALAKRKKWDLLGIGDMKPGRNRWQEVDVKFDIRSKLTLIGNTITPYE